MPSEPSEKSVKLGADTKVVMDTTNLVSAALVTVGPSARLIEAARRGLFKVVTCLELLKEFAEASHRPHISRKYPEGRSARSNHN